MSATEHPVAIHAKDGMVLLRLHGGGWVDQNKRWRDPDPALILPLLALDPEDDEQVTALADAFCEARWCHTQGGDTDQCDPLARSSMRDAIRAVAAPKLDEPKGLGAVVENARGEKFVRVADSLDGWMKDRDWQRIGGDINAVRNFGWSQLNAVRVLSEGVTA